MESNVVECGGSGGSSAGGAPGGGGAGLHVLEDVHRAYEERMELIERLGGNKKLQMQVEVLRAWVGDLVGQNTLLSRAVQELETEATNRLLLERSKHVEKKKSSTARELLTLNDTLQKENLAKEREIRRLNKDVQKYEQTIVNLRSEMSKTHNVFNMSDSKKDAEVMVGMCCAKSECGVLDGVSYGALLKEQASKYQEKMRKMENSIKISTENVRALRKVNVTLSEELHALRRVCAALDEQCRAAATRTAFKDDIIREMRRQLKQAKTKIRESEAASMKVSATEYGEKLRANSRSFDSMALCTQPRRTRPGISGVGSVGTAPGGGLMSRDSPLHPESDDCHSPRFDGSGDDVLSPRD